MSPKIVDHDARRAQIIDAAITLWSERGYEAVGIRELARHLGVSKGAMYHYFESKEALFEAVCAHLMAYDLTLFEALREEHEFVAERVLALFSLFKASSLEHGARIRLLQEYSHRQSDDYAREQLTSFRQGHIETFQRTFGVSPRLAAELYNALLGLVLQSDGFKLDPGWRASALWWSQRIGDEARAIEQARLLASL